MCVCVCVCVCVCDFEMFIPQKQMFLIKYYIMVNVFCCDITACKKNPFLFLSNVVVAVLVFFLLVRACVRACVRVHVCVCFK